MADPGAAERMGQAGLARYRVDEHHLGPCGRDAGRSRDQPVQPSRCRPRNRCRPEPSEPAEDAPEPSAQEMAVDALLKAAIAPPTPPEGLPFRSIEEVLARLCL